MRSLLFDTKNRTVVDLSLQKRQRQQCTTLWLLGISIAIGLRWNYANRDPIYPRGEGVYRTAQANTTGRLNAGDFYVAAAEAVPKGVGYEYHEITPAQQKEAVRKSAKSLALIREGIKHPFYRMPERKRSATDKAIEELLPNYINQRSLGRVLATDAHRKLVAGDANGAMSVALDEMQYGVAFGQGHSLIEGMIGNLQQLIGRQEACEAGSKLSASEARKAIIRLESILPRAATFSEMITVERDNLYDKARTRFDNAEEMILFYDAERFSVGTSSDKQESIGVPDRGWRGIARQMAYHGLIFIYTKQGLVNDFAAAMNQHIQRGKMSYQKSKLLSPLKPSSNPWIAKIIIADFWAMRQSTQISTQNQMLLGQLAVQAYKGEHNGKLPPSLEILTQGKHPYLKAIPHDLFSSDGSTPLRYNPSSGLVYSVAEDGVDNHGSGDDAYPIYSIKTRR